MLLLIWWFLALLLAALGLVMGGAHLLELPVRQSYDAELYMRVTSTLYRYFGLVGGPVQVLALVWSLGLVWLTRGRSAFGPTISGALCLGLSLLLWFLLVQPVNTAWAEALRAGPEEALQAYGGLRDRWEGGHAAAFGAWLLGFMLLLGGVLRELSSRQSVR